MTSKLNPFKKSSSTSSPDNCNVSNADSNSHKLPQSITSDGTNSSFKALLQQFGGGKTTTTNSQQTKEEEKEQTVSPRKITSYRQFSSSSNSNENGSISSANCKPVDQNVKSTSQIPRPPRPNSPDNKNTSTLRLPPLSLNRAKSAPVSPPKVSNRALSPPIRPPVHPQTSNVTNRENIKRTSSSGNPAPTGNRSRTSSHDSKSTTVRSITTENNAGATQSSKLSNKSQIRLVLEQVASRYFMHEKRVVYVGVEDYGLEKNVDASFESDGFMGNINGSMLGLESGGEGEVLIAFLGGEEKDVSRVEDEEYDDNEEGADKSEEEKDLKRSAVQNDEFGTPVKSKTGFTEVPPSNAKQQAVETSSAIDTILEQASEQLSLGKNSLALQSYRRAMKVAYANVIQVKQQLMKVKQDAIKLQYEKNDAKEAGLEEYIDHTEIDLTKQQEREFELLLLQVASRVADIHNNMGVVHEMDRHFNKAQNAYRDALDVYHNTCRRFEGTDPDVDRTYRNVNRMALACGSERERKDLHAQAKKIAKRVDGEKTFSGRKDLLSDAVDTLQRVLEVETRTIGESHPVAASTLIQMGKYHYEMREFDSAVMEIRRAIGILRDALGPNHPHVGKAILLLASVYERQGLNVSPQGKNKDDATLELYVDALDPLKATLTDIHPEVGFLYIKIGYLYGKKGDRNLSALAYKAALKAYGEPWSFSSGKVHPEVVSAWVRLTEHLMELKCWQEVLVAGRRALFLLRAAKNTLYQDAQLRPPSVDDRPQSSSKNAKISPIQITSSTYYEALYTTLQCLGQAHTSLSQFSLAKMACEESLHMAWEIALANNIDPVDPLKPNNQATIATLVQIIRAFKRLGKVLLLQKHYSDSLECFLPALQLLRSSSELESTLDAASVLGSLGFLHLKMERFLEATNFFKECLRLYQQNGVDQNDRETRKIQTWLALAESSEAERASAPPAYLEIPTVVYNDIGQSEL